VRSMCLSVCLLVTFMSCAKTAEPIEMPFASIDSLGPRNHVFHGSRGNLAGVRPTEKQLETVLPHFSQQKINNGDSGTAAAGCNTPD